MKKALALAIIALLLFQSAVFATEVDIENEVDSLVNYYKENRKDLETSDETYALAAAGLSLGENTVVAAPVDMDELESKFYSAAAKLILTAIAKGEEPENAVSGRNIVDELASMQGDDGSFGSIYTHIYAVFALKASGKAIDDEKAVQFVISKQLTDGGFSYNDELPGDIDTTAMMLSIMSLYKDMPGMSDALEKAIGFVRQCQNEVGGFESWGADNSNSLAMAIIGLTDCGIDVTTDEYKNMHLALLRFKNPDSTYRYKLDDEQIINGFSTPQVLLAFDTIKDGKSYLLTLAETGKFNHIADSQESKTSSSESQSTDNVSQPDNSNPSTGDGFAFIVIVSVSALSLISVLRKNALRKDSK